MPKNRMMNENRLADAMGVLANKASTNADYYKDAANSPSFQGSGTAKVLSDMAGRYAKTAKFFDAVRNEYNIHHFSEVYRDTDTNEIVTEVGRKMKMGEVVIDNAIRDRNQQIRVLAGLSLAFSDLPLDVDDSAFDESSNHNVSTFNRNL